MADIGIRDISVSFLDNQISNISLVQGDALTRGFDITFKNAKGEVLPPDDDYVVELVAINRNDRETPYACRHTVVGDKYRVMIPPEALSESGSVTIQLVFYQKSTGAVIHTIAQKCAVHKGLGQEFVDSNNLYVDITALRLGLEKLELLTDQYDEIVAQSDGMITAETDRKQSEEKRKSSEIIRHDNERIRKANEIDRANSEDVRKLSETERIEAENERKKFFEEWNTGGIGDIPIASNLIAGVVKVDNLDDDESPYVVPTVNKMRSEMAELKPDVEIENATEDVAGIVKVSKSDDETAPHTVMTAGKVTETIKSEIDKIPPAEGGGDMPVADSDTLGGVKVSPFDDDDKAPYTVPSIEWLDGSTVQIGKEAKVNRVSVSIGYRTDAEGFSSIAIGTRAKASARYTTVMGVDAAAQQECATAIGNRAIARQEYATAIGSNAMSFYQYSTAIGAYAETTEANQGVLGTDSNNSNGTNTWLVPGNFSVGGTKNFEIPHPNPAKTETHLLRHGAVETNSQGDNLYRYKVKAKEDGETVVINLPDYFIHLNKNIQIWATGINHFGNAFGNYKPDDETIEITCEKAGEYNILAIGTRNDNHISVQSWSDKGVEKLKGTSWTFAEDLRRAEAEAKEKEEGFDDFSEEEMD